VRNFLDIEFPNRWIGRSGEIEWPPRSSDLSPLDYFFMGISERQSYATKPSYAQTNLEELCQEIIEEAALIDPKFIRNAVASFL